MVVRLFITSTTGSRNVREHQKYIMYILSGCQIDFVSIDVSDPLNDKDKEFYRDKGARDETGNLILPQLFNDDIFCGSFADFEKAIETEKLQVFLKLITEEEWEESMKKLKKGQQQAGEEGLEIEDESIKSDVEETLCALLELVENEAELERKTKDERAEEETSNVEHVGDEKSSMGDESKVSVAKTPVTEADTKIATEEVEESDKTKTEAKKEKDEVKEKTDESEMQKKKDLQHHAERAQKVSDEAAVKDKKRQRRRRWDDSETSDNKRNGEKQQDKKVEPISKKEKEGMVAKREVDEKKELSAKKKVDKDEKLGTKDEGADGKTRHEDKAIKKTKSSDGEKLELKKSEKLAEDKEKSTLKSKAMNEQDGKKSHIKGLESKTKEDDTKKKGVGAEEVIKKQEAKDKKTDAKERTEKEVKPSEAEKLPSKKSERTPEKNEKLADKRKSIDEQDKDKKPLANYSKLNVKDDEKKKKSAGAAEVSKTEKPRGKDRWADSKARVEDKVKSRAEKETKPSDNEKLPSKKSEKADGDKGKLTAEGKSIGEPDKNKTPLVKDSRTKTKEDEIKKKPALLNETARTEKLSGKDKKADTKDKLEEKSEDKTKKEVKPSDNEKLQSKKAEQKSAENKQKLTDKQDTNKTPLEKDLKSNVKEDEDKKKGTEAQMNKEKVDAKKPSISKDSIGKKEPEVASNKTKRAPRAWDSKPNASDKAEMNAGVATSHSSLASEDKLKAGKSSGIEGNIAKETSKTSEPRRRRNWDAPVSSNPASNDGKQIKQAKAGSSADIDMSDGKKGKVSPNTSKFISSNKESKKANDVEEKKTGDKPSDEKNLKSKLDDKNKSTTPITRTTRFDTDKKVTDSSGNKIENKSEKPNSSEHPKSNTSIGKPDLKKNTLQERKSKFETSMNKLSSQKSKADDLREKSKNLKEKTESEDVGKKHANEKLKSKDINSEAKSDSRRPSKLEANRKSSNENLPSSRKVSAPKIKEDKTETKPSMTKSAGKNDESSTVDDKNKPKANYIDPKQTPRSNLSENIPSSNSLINEKAENLADKEKVQNKPERRRRREW